MILDRIIEDKKLYVEEAKKRYSIGDLRVGNGRGSRSLIKSIKSCNVAIIAEIKRRSPSGGNMDSSYSLTELASIYEQSGAAGISVLTDEKYFGGRPEDLREVKAGVALPVLRKDFIIDEYQIYEAKAYGADVILLIAAILDDIRIREFLALAHELGLEVLLESHTEDELRRSIESGARLIGINNRNLDTLKTDVSTSIRLMRMVPDDRIVISESGISSSSDIKRLLNEGADGFLIGESLLKIADPGRKLAELINL
ncbi:MAG: indole-3-glycerol phosphate synthase TrpC [Actinobacteria bacterium]|nr:indole-3-glycerol phosphate synthase TrpC [Actinomycetota bacterium]